MVPDWRSVTAGSLNFGGGVRFIKQANCTCARKNTTNTWLDARHRMRPWFRTAEPLEERRYDNWITTPTLPGGCMSILIEIGPVVSEDKSFENAEHGRQTDAGDYQPMGAK